MIKNARQGALIAIAVLVLTTLAVRWWDFRTPDALFNRSYAAVLLSSGQVVYGRYVERFSDWVKIENAHYLVQSGTDQLGQPSDLRLLKKATDVHGPSEMNVERSAVVWVQKLKEDSRLSRFMRGELTEETPAPVPSAAPSVPRISTPSASASAKPSGTVRP